MTKRLSPEHKAAISKAMRGREISPETRQKISKSHIGRKMPSPSEEARKKISAAIKAVWDERKRNGTNKLTPEMRAQKLAKRRATALLKPPKPRKPHSEETKRKIAESMRKTPLVQKPQKPAPAEPKITTYEFGVSGRKTAPPKRY